MSYESSARLIYGFCIDDIRDYVEGYYEKMEGTDLDIVTSGDLTGSDTNSYFGFLLADADEYGASEVELSDLSALEVDLKNFCTKYYIKYRPAKIILISTYG